MAKKAGVDYEKLLDQCLAKDTAAMHTLFTITKTAGFDAASAEGHASVLGALMRKLGDDFFGKCLEAEPADMQAAVRDQLVYDAGYDPPHLNEIPNLKKNFPRTFPSSYEY